MPDLRGLLIRLARAEFPFVVVGGYAAFAHGVSLVTQDMDVCCTFTEETLHKLRAALEGLHPVHRMHPDRMPLTITRGFSKGLHNLYLDTDLGPLDLLGEIKGIGSYPEVLAQSTVAIVGEIEIRLLSLDGMIAAKEAMDRDRDHEAARQLRVIREMKDEAGEGRGTTKHAKVAKGMKGRREG